MDAGIPVRPMIPRRYRELEHGGSNPRRPRFAQCVTKQPGCNVQLEALNVEQLAADPVQLCDQLHPLTAKQAPDEDCALQLALTPMQEPPESVDQEQPCCEPQSEEVKKPEQGGA